MSQLRLEGVSKRWGNNPALCSIDLELPQGLFACILGPSGCGKTSLLHILAGIIRPDRGRIYLNGKEISALAPEKRRIGMVFQHYALFPNLTVEGNIAYGLHGAFWTKAKKQARVDELLAATLLENCRGRFPADLSGGQQQRTALARALAPLPDLLLLDEPLSALDAKVRDSLGQELLRLQRQTGISTIMVTHDQTEALSLADRIILMDNGRLVQTGSPEALYRRPKTRFAAEFLGRMNTFRMRQIAGGKSVGIRYEEVLLLEANEENLKEPDTFTGKIVHRALLGPYYRFEVLLNDFQTRIFIDVPRDRGAAVLQVGELAAVSLPRQCWRVWDAGA